MNNNARYDRSTNFLELEVNVPRTIGILRDVSASRVPKLASAHFQNLSLIAVAMTSQTVHGACGKLRSSMWRLQGFPLFSIQIACFAGLSILIYP